jgi:hypothetical protein
MGATLLRILIALAVPVVVFVVAGLAMMRMTERDQFPQRRDPVTVPLNFRLAGYDVEGARAYWTWLGPQGREAERRFLEADLVFPFFYGGALLFSLLYLWAGLGRPFDATWLVAPVAITVIADWIENLVHLRQLGHFVRNEVVQPGAMQLATLATSTKLVMFWVATGLVVALCGWLLVRRIAASG